MSSAGRIGRSDALTGAFLLSPALLLFILFVAGPAVAALAISFLEWNLIEPPTFVGLDNFQRLSGDPIALKALFNTFAFAFVSVGLHVGIGLLLALAVNRSMPTPLRYFLRTTFFFPVILSWAAVALIWRLILDPNFGFINFYLELAGLSPPPLLVTPATALASLIFIDLWHSVGFTFILLLAGLQTIPAELQEAARCDGAGRLRILFQITLPLMSPTVLFTSIVSVIAAFQVFAPMYIITQGGPSNSTLSILLDMYYTGFRSFEMGYASSLSVILFMILVAFTVAQLRFTRRWVYYEAG